MDTVQLLRELSEASGVAGFEEQVRSVARQALEPHADSLRSDALGNLIALRRGSGAAGANGRRRSIMLAAHMDEIGLIVTGFDEGFIRFGRVGGVDLRTIVGQEVLVHGKRPLSGIVASRPPHVLSEEERNQAIPIEKLFIDVGLPADRLAEWVHVGDPITLRREFLMLGEDYASGKALDDRAGVASLALCLQMLSGLRHTWDVYAVATTQEEVGLRGAMVSAYGVAPDIAIAVDVGFGAQPGVSEQETVPMDSGPAIGKGPNIHPLMLERLLATAKEHELPYELEINPGDTGTDAWAIQVTREGIPSALLSIPVRYMHTSVETVCIKDIQRTARLMALYIAGLDDEFAAQLGLAERV
jgi:putative aminopeptidase FrvX